MTEQEIKTKKLTGISSNIQLTVYQNKLCVVNLINAKLVEEEEEDASSFFGSIATKDDTSQVVIPYIVSNDSAISTASDWMYGDGKLNLESYPDEMRSAITKSINQNKGIAKKEGIYFVSEELLDNEERKKLSKYFEETKSAYSALMSDIKKYKTAGMSDNVSDFAERYMFKKHLLIQGEKGGGKTYGVHKILNEEGIQFVETKGHEGIESIDLLGYYVKDETGNLIWMDGVLAETFRKAKSEKTVLFIDEMLRIPSRELNILVGALTPMSDNTYTLRTNRITSVDEGIGHSEIISVPTENLWCVATTNVGAGYEVDDIDDALSDRFRIMIKSTSPSELEAIILSQLSEKGFNESIASKLLDFYGQMRDLVEAGQLEKYINTRHLCETIQMAESEGDIKSYLFDLLPNWVSQETNGSLSKPEMELINKLIKKIF